MLEKLSATTQGFGPRTELKIKGRPSALWRPGAIWDVAENKRDLSDWESETPRVSSAWPGWFGGLHLASVSPFTYQCSALWKAQTQPVAQTPVGNSSCTCHLSISQRCRKMPCLTVQVNDVTGDQSGQIIEKPASSAHILGVTQHSRCCSYYPCNEGIGLTGPRGILRPRFSGSLAVTWGYYPHTRLLHTQLLRRGPSLGLPVVQQLPWGPVSVCTLSAMATSYFERQPTATASIRGW